MKKTLSLVLALVLCLGAVSALADTYGLGIVTGLGSSKNAEVVDGDPYEGTAQVDSTVCAVVLDDAGVIVSVKFDVAQTKVKFDAEGQITTDLTAPVRSKMELQDDYGMRGVSEIGAELFEQLVSFEEFCVGKVAADVIGMETYQRDDNHTRVPSDADLKTSVTIDVGGLLDALAKAVENAK